MPKRKDNYGRNVRHSNADLRDTERSGRNNTDNTGTITAHQQHPASTRNDSRRGQLIWTKLRTYPQW
ncbi:hypothetical protein IKG05_01605 [Candidatus Saccharibacteria bacterium]|nr:hypothetical protein [Candidatus Saccharibacteria bacterium]